MTPTNGAPQWNWIESLERAARRQGIELPAPADFAMNVVGWRNESATRRVSFRRPLRHKSDPLLQRVTWGFWTEGESVEPVLLLEEIGLPTDERADHYFRLFRQWLIEELSIADFRDRRGLAFQTAQEARDSD